MFASILFIHRGLKIISFVERPSVSGSFSGITVSLGLFVVCVKAFHLSWHHRRGGVFPRSDLAQEMPS